MRSKMGLSVFHERPAEVDQTTPHGCPIHIQTSKNIEMIVEFRARDFSFFWVASSPRRLEGL